ncbi:hypothetical protein HK103_005545 [Boothiomyces macroporosus]|uniref:Uncharacterized protein n=1 Tax=Boothiomyces macroporosus TaxID=261099 RepID=A0AAD5UFS0_9FUNG|nr:hypothetical protein HK103_005545 [Boothiomyces macroporosus]
MLELFLFITYILGQDCSTTNRLCIEQNITVGQPVKVFWPVNLIPTDINPNSLILDLFAGDSGSIYDACNSTSFVKVQEFSVAPKVAYPTINFTEITVTNNDDGKALFMQLHDPNNRQCLLGPNVAGKWTASIIVNPASTTGTTTVSGQPSATSTSASDSSSNGNSKYVIAIFSVLIAVVVLLAIFICYRLVFSKTKPPQDPEILKIEDSPIPEPRMTMDVTRPPATHFPQITDHEPPIRMTFEHSRMGVGSTEVQRNSDESLLEIIKEY